MRPVKIVHKALLKNTNWRPLLVDVAIVANSWQLKSKQTVFPVAGYLVAGFSGGQFFQWPVFFQWLSFPVAGFFGGQFFRWPVRFFSAAVFPVTGCFLWPFFRWQGFPVTGFSSGRFFRWPVLLVAFFSGAVANFSGSKFSCIVEKHTV